MLILRAFPPSQGLASASPFVLKVMGYLKTLELEWQIDIKADIRKQPNGKFPVLVDGATLIPDSSAIIPYLEKKAGHGVNDRLSDEQKVLSHALVRMAEEHLYFFVVYNRWAVDENFAQIRPSLEKLAPFPMSKLLPNIIRKTAIGQVQAQGVGRMSSEMRATRLAADFGAFEHQLGSEHWLFGEAPTAADFSFAAMLVTILACPADTETRRELTARPHLVAYAERAKAELFPSADALPFPPRT